MTIIVVTYSTKSWINLQFLLSYYHSEVFKFGQRMGNYFAIYKSVYVFEIMKWSNCYDEEKSALLYNIRKQASKINMFGSRLESIWRFKFQVHTITVL